MNDDEEIVRAKKQKYLHTEIIQKGHDPLKFKEFLESKKPNGINKPIKILKILNK